MAITTAGYDAPQLKREDDFLDRWKFAADLFTIVKDTSSEWSVRIGVFAKWGVGKTTVLRFLEQMAVAEHLIPVRFSPWSAHSWDDLWAEFAAVLVPALESHNAATKTAKKLKYKLLGKKFQMRVKPLATDLASLSATAFAASLAFTVSIE
jgi:predicted KAP-like P-loop ATPase